MMPYPMMSYPMSSRGWISVDYLQQIWIPCPPVFPEGLDRDSWASLYAEEWWWNAGREHSEREVKSLARTLAGIHEYAYEHLAMHRGFIHLPDLRVVPLLVCFGVWEAVGERAAQLRALTYADNPEAIQPPLVDEFATERLGSGLKTLSYTRQGETVTGHLNYAWRSEEHATALRMFTACPDLGRLQRALPDTERLARGVTIISRDHVLSAEVGGSIMPEPDVTSLVRRAAITMPVGLILLIGGGATIAAGATAVGAILIVLAVLSVSVGCVLMFKVRNRARAFSRDAQARQQADLDAAFRDRGDGSA
jgi:hypothetical protein